MRPRIYIDTSVFGGYFDDEFAQYIFPLFERISKNEFLVLFSAVTQDELDNAPQMVKNLVRGLKTECTEFLDITDESVELANA